MRVIVTAGGTGGHIYPALATLDKIKEVEPDSEFLYIGTDDRMEKDIVPKRNIKFIGFKMIGTSKNPFKMIYMCILFLINVSKTKKIIKEFHPDIVMGFGGYITGPVIYAAKKSKIKTFIHEQNSIPGKANKFLSKYADIIGVSFPLSEKHFAKGKVVYTGNPASESAVNALELPKSELGFKENEKLVLIVMGSLGAARVNEVIMKTLPMFNGKNYQILYITGNEHFDSNTEIELPNNVRMLPYLENMARIMKNTDLMVTRAGATTLAELSALRIPSIIIPSPYVPNNHQYFNAVDFFNKGSSVLLEEKDLTSDKLYFAIDNLITNDTKLNYMKNTLGYFSVTDSATRIYNAIKR